LTPASGRSMLLGMLRRHSGLRVTIAILAALAVIIAGPIHAAHHHDDNRLHAPCAVCQLHSPACQQTLVPCAGVSLQPLFTLSLVSAPSVHSVSVSSADTRAPPLSLA
jgi:hypothetical protein